MAVQIEQHAEVRPALPTPQGGDLPLPEGLPPAMLDCNPQAVEDLNVVVPKGAQPLSSQALNKQVRLKQHFAMNSLYTLSHFQNFEIVALCSHSNSSAYRSVYAGEASLSRVAFQNFLLEQSWDCSCGYAFVRHAMMCPL